MAEERLQGESGGSGEGLGWEGIRLMVGGAV